MPKINIDFYRVTIPRGGSLDAVFAAICKTGCNAKRNIEVNAAPVRLQEGGSVAGDFCAGDMIRLQMEGWPSNAGLDGTSEPLSLGKDRGLGHETAFLYYIPWKILLMERNRSGVSPAAMARYIEKHGGFEQPVHLDPVPLSTAEKQLTNFKKFRRLRVRVASVGRVNAIKNDDDSTSKVMGLLQGMSTPATSTPVVDVMFSVNGPRHDSLDAGGVIRTIRNVLKIPADEAVVERLEVSGSDTPEGTLEMLNYMNFVLTDTQTVAGRNKKRMPYHQRAAALMASFTKKKPLLESLYAKLGVSK